MQAKARNLSDYPLLASDRASIFLDDNFVSKSSLPLTGPGNTFEFFLGVDPSIKAEYLPCQTISKTKGWFQGAASTKYSYCTLIHNTKRVDCRIIVSESLPRSEEEKITVELLEPQPSSLTTAKAASASTGIQSASDVLASLSGNSEEASRTTLEPLPADFITHNQNTGSIVWLRTVPAKTSLELKFQYRVSWPQGKTVEIVES
jgi:uncharacterized protein (TIGR02231 family)